MNYDEAMKDAEKVGTTRRNKRRRLYQRVTWSVGGAILIAVLIWLPAGPLQTHARRDKETVSAGVIQTPQRLPGDSTLAPTKVESGRWQHVMLLPKERKFLRIDVNAHVEIIGKGVRVFDICADNQARLPRQCPVASPAQQVSIENERDETNIILAQAFF